MFRSVSHGVVLYSSIDSRDVARANAVVIARVLDAKSEEGGRVAQPRPNSSHAMYASPGPAISIHAEDILLSSPEE